MPRVALGTRQTVAPHKSEPDVFPVPDDCTVGVVRLARNGWPQNGKEVVRVTFEVSTDGGQSWAGGFAGAMGGDHINRFGGLSPETTLKMPLPPGKGRIGRVILEAFAPLQTKIDVDLE